MAMTIDRRGFLGAVAAATLSRRAYGANDSIRVGVMGTGGRGTSLAGGFEKQAGVTVAYVCDVDKKRANLAAAAIEKIEGKAPEPVTDFRRILDDKSIDILVVATSNHWHAPAAILGCAAGKHVYVEKPCSHNPREGELLVEAARKHKRHVQMGNQRRSSAYIIDAVEVVRKGAIGRAYYSRSWYSALRTSIGRGKEVPVPEGLDFELWQGPAPRRPYRDNILHYNWHWFWHWGNGEIGNNGVHSIDLCRWGLGVDYPTRVASSGGRRHFEDDQETPDTHVVSYEFEGNKQILWEGLSSNKYGLDPTGFGITFHGTEGTILITGSGYTVLDKSNKEVRKVPGGLNDATHMENLIDAIRNGAKLTSEIEEGHKSTLLCHLGNISHRVGRSLRCDPKDGKILGDAEGMKLWSREYAPGWEPKV